MIANFFYAIERDMLSVTIAPSDEMRDRDLDRLDKSTILEWFDYLIPDSAIGQPRTTEDDAIAEAYQFWDVIRGPDPNAEKEDADLGHCRLWIRVCEDLPSKVGFVRRTGMLITTQQPGLMRFRGLDDFIALCVFDSDKGNELLRNMENPQHDRFEPDRLPEDERRRGRSALKRITSWIREEIGKCATPTSEGEATDLDELAQYLPDLQPDEEFDVPSRKESERGFNGPNVVRLKSRVVAVKSSVVDAVASDDVDGDDTGTSGGGDEGEKDGDGGDGIGEKDGVGAGGGGDKGGGSVLEAVPISDVRLVPVPGNENRYRVSFVSASGGRAQLALSEAGDSGAIARTDVQAFRLDGEPLDLDAVELTEGNRTAIEITGTKPIGERAWLVRALRQVRS